MRLLTVSSDFRPFRRYVATDLQRFADLHRPGNVRDDVFDRGNRPVALYARGGQISAPTENSRDCRHWGAMKGLDPTYANTS